MLGQIDSVNKQFGFKGLYKEQRSEIHFKTGDQWESNITNSLEVSLVQFVFCIMTCKYNLKTWNK